MQLARPDWRESVEGAQERQALLGMVFVSCMPGAWPGAFVIARGAAQCTGAAPQAAQRQAASVAQNPIGSQEGRFFLMRRNSSRISSAAPIVIPMSATLKAGKCDGPQ